MKHTRVASHIPSPYSKNSPSIKYKPDVKKNSLSGEASSKPTSKVSQGELTLRPQSQHGHDILEKKFSPVLIDRKNDYTTSLYQLAKGLDKDKQTYSKLYKSKETQQQQQLQQQQQQQQVQQKKVTKPSSRQSDKTPVYQSATSKSKKPEENRSALNLSNQASSRVSSRIIGHDEQNESILQKVSDNLLSTKRALAGNVDLSGSRYKSKGTPCHQKSLSNNFFKGSQQRTPAGNESKQISNFQASTNNLSFNEVSHDQAKTPDPHRAESNSKSSQAAGGSSFNDALAQKLKLALQGLQGDLQNAKHRRGLSSGQAPIFIEQQIAQEKIKPIEFVPQVQQDPQQEQDDFYSQFFHSDKMTFDFEKLIVSQRGKNQHGSSTTSVTPVNKPATAHTRTRSIEDPNSLLPTKASSRWNTKRSSVGDEGQTGGKEMFNLIEQISDLDKTDFEKEELRRYLRG